MNALPMNVQAERTSFLRYATLFVIALNVCFNLFSITLFPDPTVEEVIRSYPVLFAPRGYIFFISLTHLLLVVIAIIYVMRDSNHKAEFDKLALLFIPTIFFELGWQYMFTHHQLSEGMAFLVAMMICNGLLFVRIHQVFSETNKSHWLHVPFSLYLGWSSVIAISASASWLTSLGWAFGEISEITCTVVMIFVTGLLGLLVAFRKQDATYPLVMAWCTISIWFSTGPKYPAISFAALSVGIFMIWCSLIVMIGYSKTSSTSFSATAHA